MKYRENQNESALLYQEADVSSKSIFGNHTLCAQFLRDYSGLPILADVQPEDIEDVSERYHLFREVELQADTVKKVRLRNQTDGKPQDIYVISLIEHKSEVDYDVTMQILRYMVCIWENYVRELEETSMAKSTMPDRRRLPGEAEQTADIDGKQKQRKKINRRKDFRYPPIYPIVYYEGTGEWTAARSLKDRVLLGDLFQAYIPDITYKLVRTREYSNEELISREDAISLVMLLNKIQQAEDFQEAVKVSGGCLNEIIQRATVDVVDIILSTVRSLCRRLNLTVEETTDLLEKVRGGNMGYLWENMEKMDIQLERRNTAEQRERAEKAEEKLHNMYHMLIRVYHKQGLDQKAIKEQLVSEMQLDEKEVDELLAKYWENGTTD